MFSLILYQVSESTLWNFSPPLVLTIMAARAMDENAEVFDEEPTDVVYMGSPRFEKVYKTALRSSGLNYLLTDISCN